MSLPVSSRRDGRLGHARSSDLAARPPAAVRLRQRDDRGRRGLLPGFGVRSAVSRARAGTRARAASAATPSGCSSCSTESDVKATFFVLGWVAERFPALVRRDRRATATSSRRTGSSTGWCTRRRPRSSATISGARASRSSRRGGVRSSAIGRPATRSSAQSLWALDVLIEEGYVYDSSIYPIRHDRYGIPDWHARDASDRAAARIASGSCRDRRSVSAGAEPADRRRRLLPAAAVSLDASWHSAPERDQASRRSSTCTPGRSTRTSRGLQAGPPVDVPALPESGANRAAVAAACSGISRLDVSATCSRTSGRKGPTTWQWDRLLPSDSP